MNTDGMNTGGPHVTKAVMRSIQTTFLAAAVMVTSIGGCATTGTTTQQKDPTAAKAAAAYRQGLELTASGDHEEALGQYESARELAWAPMVDVQLARTLDRLGRKNLACRYWLGLADTGELARDAQADPEAKAAMDEAKARSGECWNQGMGLAWPSKGPADAPVTIVEFSDFQCPFCGRVKPTIKTLLKEYPGQIRVVFMHNPLPFHKQAAAAARATVAAHRQGRFWPMHDRMFEEQRSLKDEPWDALAEEVGLDLNRFRADLNDAGTSKHVAHQMAIAASLGARGTPSFFINGEKLSGAQPITKFRSVVDAALVEADAELKKGTPKSRLHEVLSERNFPRYTSVMVRGEKPPALPPARPSRPAKAVDNTIWKVTLAGDEPARGPKNAPVTIVAFSDFQCPFCTRAEKTMDALAKRYGKDVRIVWKHFPLAFHKQAPSAHRASIAAHQQGKFWEMQKLLMGNQRDLNRKAYERWGKKIGLNMRRFNKALDQDDAALQAVIDRDMKLGASVGVKGTPNFFVNGKKLVGAQPEARFATVIDAELVATRRLLKSGVNPSDIYATRLKAGKTHTDLQAEVRFNHTGRPFIGPADAAATVTVFTDYQCSYCQRIEAALKDLVRKELPGKVRVVFAQMPLSFHKQAMPAARAVIAAHKMGAFEKMHDLLFANGRKLSPELIETLAAQAGLNMARFRK
ncbi:MAG: protein-disulfide isomerase, partial [Myxococcota bacterium]